jgi:hypothetical protein
MKNKFKKYYNLKKYNGEAVGNVSFEITKLYEEQRVHGIIYGFYSKELQKEINEMKELAAYLDDLEE